MAEKEQYIVSARKYRPANFKTVVGQRALTATLKNAIKSGKLAQAYLFCGPRGVGKTSCARIFAKTINCSNPTPDGEACGECENCKAIERGTSFNLVELDAASNNSVDDIRDISNQVNIPAQEGEYRVFIIDEVHMLSNNAFNAFLKTLEEPPKNVVFILATTERHKVIPTILSRCQVYDFRRITINDIVDHLEYVAKSEGVEADREALGVIALKADGAMRDALSIFDQVVASTHGHVDYQGTIDALNVLDHEYYFRLLDIFKEGDVAEALLTFKEIIDKGFDAQFFVNGLAQHIRNLMVGSDERTLSLLETSEELKARYRIQAANLPVEWYYSAMKILNDTDFNYRLSGNKRLLVELALIRLSGMNGGEEKPVPFKIPAGSKPQPVPGKNSEAIEKKVGKEPVKKVGEGESLTSGSSSEVKTLAPGLEPAIKRERKRPIGERTRSFRINAESSSTGTRDEKKERNSQFSEQEFLRAWQEYSDRHPEKRILVAAMRGGSPKRLSPNEYLFVVDHPAQKQSFETSGAELLEFLKQQLDNDTVSLRVEINEKENMEKGMNPKEFLKKVLDENPVLAKFLKDVDAELEQN